MNLCLLLQIHMHGTDFHSALSHFFHPHVLPPEYGGQGPGIEKACQDWTNQLLQFEHILSQIAAHPTGDISSCPDEPLIEKEVNPE